MPLRERISRSAEALLELRAQNLPLQFYFSTLQGLGDLVEDEVIPTPVPMKVIFRVFNVFGFLTEFGFLFKDQFGKHHSAPGGGQALAQHHLPRQPAHRRVHPRPVHLQR